MLVSRTGLSPIMVGRAAELGRLASLLATSATPTVALVAGEAGIGKTRLVQELVDALPKGTLVLPGQADPGTVGRPMDLFLDAVRRVEGDGHPLLHDAVADDSLPTDERVRAGVDLVRSLAGGQPGVIVFEDLHWADAESLAVFERLAEPEGGPLLVIGTYRPDGLTRRHPAAEMLPRLDRRHSITHVHLDRLSPADVSTFLRAVHGHDPSYRAVDALHTRTGGNPFFLEELIAAAGPRTDDLDDLPLPWTVAELVRNQLDDLSSGVREVVTAASVLGRRVSFDLLAGVTHLTEGDLIDRLKSGVDSGLLIETEADLFGFHHEIAREAIESSLLGRERRRLHEAALDALRLANSHDRVAIVHHARGAGHYDEMVQQARLGAHDSLRLGSTHQALRLAETGLSEAEEDLELLGLATEAAWLTGLLDEATEHGERWLTLARQTGDLSQEALALAGRLRVAFDLGDLDDMVPLTHALAAIVDHLPTNADRATALAALAQSAMLRDQVEATIEWADRAIAIAEAEGLDRVRITALVQKASVLVLQADTSETGRALLAGAADEAEREGFHVVAALAMVNLVWQARQVGRMDEARALILRMGQLARAAGYDTLVSHAQTEALAGLAAADGDLTAAIRILDDGERADPSHVLPRNRRWLAVLRAGLALEAGDLDSAVRLTAAAKPPTTRSLMGVLGLDLHLACLQADGPTARAALAQMVAAAGVEDHIGPGQLHDLVGPALAVGLSGEELQPLLERMGHFSGNRYRDPSHPWPQLLAAQVAEAEGRLEEAVAGYRVAARSADDVSGGMLARHRGTAHVGAARSLIALDRLDDAREHAEAAAPHLERWSGWRVEDLRAVQRRLGLVDGPDGPEELTPREREVATLLAEGLTNAQLAERLFISPRTAAVHVSNILAKLDMASRAEVAAWAVREGLDAR